MTPIVLLFLTGALLLTAEVFLPGAIAGIVGGVALLIGSVLAFTNFGAGVGTLASLAAGALVCAMLYAELVWLPRTKFGRRLVVEATVEGQAHPAQALENEVVGKRGVAVTTLAPSGFVTVEGRRYEAFCRSGLVKAGAALQVIGVDNFRLIVSETTPS